MSPSRDNKENYNHMVMYQRKRNYFGCRQHVLQLAAICQRGKSFHIKIPFKLEQREKKRTSAMLETRYSTERRRIAGCHIIKKK